MFYSYSYSPQDVDRIEAVEETPISNTFDVINTRTQACLAVQSPADIGSTLAAVIKK